MNNSFTKKTEKAVPLSSLYHAVKRKRKMTLESDYCENCEIDCTIEDFLILQYPFTQGGLGYPPLSLIFYKNFITCTKEI